MPDKDHPIWKVAGIALGGTLYFLAVKFGYFNDPTPMDALAFIAAIVGYMGGEFLPKMLGAKKP